MEMKGTVITSINHSFGLLCQTQEVECCLHNMIITSIPSSLEEIGCDMPEDNIIWIRPSGGSSTVEAFHIRNQFTE